MTCIFAARVKLSSAVLSTLQLYQWYSWKAFTTKNQMPLVRKCLHRSPAGMVGGSYRWGYKRETEEESVSFPMKIRRCRCRSDSLAVISYRDINVFTYVNTPYYITLYYTILGYHTIPYFLYGTVHIKAFCGHLGVCVLSLVDLKRFSCTTQSTWDTHFSFSFFN